MMRIIAMGESRAACEARNIRAGLSPMRNLDCDPLTPLVQSANWPCLPASSHMTKGRSAV